MCSAYASLYFVHNGLSQKFSKYVDKAGIWWSEIKDCLKRAQTSTNAVVLFG